ncbi:MAG: O-antigen ligase family protein [Candidatus Methanosuratincola sp.]
MMLGESKFVTNGVPVLVGAALGVVVANLIMDGDWHLALIVVFSLPAFVLIHRYPFISILIWFLLTSFLMVTPSMPSRMLYWFIHRALPPATVIVIVVSSLLRVNQRKLPRLGWPEFAMAGYVLVSSISIFLLNEYPRATMILFYDRVISPMCLYLIVRFTYPSEKDLSRLVPIAFFLAVSQSVIGLLSWFAPSVLPSAWLTHEGLRSTGSLGNPSVYSATLMFSCLILLQAALSRKSGMVKNIYLPVCLLALFGVFFSFSRASWLGGLLVIIGLVFLYPRDLLRFSFIALPVFVLLIGGGLLSSELQWARQRLYSEQSEGSALSRLPVYMAAYRMFESKPFFGWGYGNFDRYDRQFQERVADLVNPGKDHASHNVYLTILAEQGLIGFTLFLAPLFWWLISSLRPSARMEPEGFLGTKFRMMLWLFILFYITLNNFSNIKVVFGLGLYWITLALIANMIQPDHPAVDHRKPENNGFDFSQYYRS